MFQTAIMSDRSKHRVENLLIGVTFLVLAFTALYKARVAIVEHKPIVFKFASVSPTQTYIAAALSVALGLYFVIIWWRERGSK